jgi:hypothetical protein
VNAGAKRSFGVLSGTVLRVTNAEPGFEVVRRIEASTVWTNKPMNRLAEEAADRPGESGRRVCSHVSKLRVCNAHESL